MDAVAEHPAPTRFRAAPERNAAIARPLRVLGRVWRTDEELLAELGRRMLARNSTGLLGVRMLGWVVTPAESRAVMHLRRYVGWLMGVDEDWLFATERAQNAFNHHVVLAQEGPTPAGEALARALVEGQRGLVAPGPFAALRGGWRRRRLLGLLRWFLGRAGLRDLGLPPSSPWPVVPVAARNLVMSLLVARTRRGRRWLRRRGDAFLARELPRRFPDRSPAVADLPR